MKKVIIIHCWEGYPEYCWYPYVREKLEGYGFHVSVPAFPHTKLPQLNQWLDMLRDVVGVPHEEIILVGHSIGAVTIVRYLEKLMEGQKIGGAVLVAGFTDDLGYKELANFFVEPMDLSAAKRYSKGFVAIHSDNDPYVSLKYGDIFRDQLGAELIIKHAMKHFSGSADTEGSCIELPDVVEAVMKFSARDRIKEVR